MLEWIELAQFLCSICIMLDCCFPHHFTASCSYRFLGKVPRHIKVGYRYTGRYKKANGYRTKNKGKSMESLCADDRFYRRRYIERYDETSWTLRNGVLDSHQSKMSMEPPFKQAF